ncbi:ATP-dependent metallopeptidase FtsH/Yme1/Tma family protein [Candidatus Desantisbacteria bacterium]|nr:ATP-dependent metallopeptidase FtsH/Yme1/Tma family protein [Candidatus Desantisbacteria bacterium]
MNNFYKNLALWLVIAIIVVIVFQLIQNQKSQTENIVYSDFISNVQNKAVSEVTITENNVTGKLRDKRQFSTYLPSNDAELLKILRENNVKITVKPSDNDSWWMPILANVLPILLLIAVWIFFMRQMQGTGNKAMAFGKSRAKLHSEKQTKITFKDVAGADEPKQELEEIIEFLREPKKFQKLGGKIPKGVLLFGPPGTGKTLLAKAVAGEANTPFFSISGSDFVEMFVGVGASRVRDLFEQGKKNAPCIIFIDEIDAVGRQRFAGLGGGHDEREQTLNALLVEMDGFASNEGVILIAATNRPDVLDPALLRPGRFDRHIVVDRPDIKGREGIIKVHTKNIPLNTNIDIKILARRTPGFSGADLANMINEAALLAARRNKTSVDMDEFEEGIERILAGPERKSRVVGDKEKRIIAFHEAGHALVAKMTPGSDPVHKISIIPRGIGALGYTLQLPIEDRYLSTKTEIMNQIGVLLGGRVAEDLIFSEITTGAQNDLERATETAHKMVCEFGMSEALGPLTFGRKDKQVFLGRDIAKDKNYSEKTAIEIDKEVRGIVEACYEKVKNLMETHKTRLIKLAETLLEKEILDSEEVDVILSGKDETGAASV